MNLLEAINKEGTELFQKANSIRNQVCGNGVFLRGLIEFSNRCGGSCLYCGLNKNNKTIQRYTLSKEEILAAVDKIQECKIKSVVLQSGEDKNLDPDFLADIIVAIKKKYDIAITLSAGEKDRETYSLWKKAGADRYLLKIETTDSEIYSKLHPDMSLENRMNCSEVLKSLGYQNGSGLLIGLPDQTYETIVKDIKYIADNKFDMIGVGLFIPHKDTALSDMPIGNLNTVLKTLAILRILLPTANMPATTAIGSLEEDYRPLALNAGANVLMPNFTPSNYKKLYEIYPNKKCTSEDNSEIISSLDAMVKSVGRHLDFSRGDAYNE